jgi:hypothetical protein
MMMAIPTPGEGAIAMVSSDVATPTSSAKAARKVR